MARGMRDGISRLWRQNTPQWREMSLEPGCWTVTVGPNNFGRTAVTQFHYKKRSGGAGSFKARHLAQSLWDFWDLAQSWPLGGDSAHLILPISTTIWSILIPDLLGTLLTELSEYGIKHTISDGPDPKQNRQSPSSHWGSRASKIWLEALSRTVRFLDAIHCETEGRLYRCYLNDDWKSWCWLE